MSAVTHSMLMEPNLRAFSAFFLCVLVASVVTDAPFAIDCMRLYPAAYIYWQETADMQRALVMLRFEFEKC